MSEVGRFSRYIEAIAVPEWQRDSADTIALRAMAVADAEQAELRAEVERLRLAREAREGALTMLRKRCSAAEAKVERVEGVRARLLDPTASVTEGPHIARIKVESWLRAALDGDV